MWKFGSSHSQISTSIDRIIGGYGVGSKSPAGKKVTKLADRRFHRGGHKAISSVL
jgi:hypothetical protein